jgi:elongation factor G
MAREISIQRFRNIGVMAHIDAGKTTVSERILFYTGKIHALGEVHHGTAALDDMDEERKRGITISSAATTTHWSPLTGPLEGQAHRINLIDTPGHVDFTVEVERSLRVLDGAVAVFDASNGVEPQSEAVWRQADRYGVPRIAFVNKMDKLGADLAMCLASMRERLGANAVAVQLPVGREAGFEGVIDLLGLEAWLYQAGERAAPPTRAPVPDELLDEARAARASLVEACCDASDALLDRYLAVGPAGVTAEELSAALRKGTLERSLVPVLCGSAIKNKGIQMLLDAIVSYLPSPADRPPVTGVSPSGARVSRPPSDDAPLCAQAFKLTSDRGAQLTWVRVYAGTLRPGDLLENGSRGGAERAGRLLLMHAGKHHDIHQAHAGVIAAIVGLRSARTGDTLCSPGEALALESIQVPEPVVSLAIEPRTAADQDRLAGALRKLSTEDPSLRVSTDAETGETLIAGMGELHLEIVLSRLSSEHRVSGAGGQPAGADRETLAREASADHKYARQNGGVGQFARVALVVAPLARGAGFVFEDATRGGVVPREFVPAIEKGVRGAMERGVLAGYPIVDVSARLVDGAFHTKDSSPAAFEMAGSLAFQEAAAAAGGVLLEPLMRVELITPDASLGAALGDLSARRGQVCATSRRGDAHVVDALVPLAALFGYVSDLRNLSRGRATATMTLERYEPAPQAVAAEVARGRR